MTRRVSFFLSAFLAAWATAATVEVRAEGLQSHSVVYDIKIARPEKDKEVYVEGQSTFTMTRRCEDWGLGDILQVGVEKSAAAVGQKKLGEKADRLEERVNAVESLDGHTLSYQTRLHLNARITKATGKATFGQEGGKIAADFGRYKQDSELPAGTLAPVAARAALVKALMVNPMAKADIRTVDMMRFHKPVAQSFIPLPPQDVAISRELPKDLHVTDKAFATGRMWAVLRRVPDNNEFGDELWLIHESGVIVRQIIERFGVKLLLEAREITLFPAPTCK